MVDRPDIFVEVGGKVADEEVGGNVVPPLLANSSLFLDATAGAGEVGGDEIAASGANTTGGDTEGEDFAASA